MGIISKLFGGKSKEKEQKPEVNITFSVESSTRQVDRLIAENAELTMADIGGYVSPSGGFVNWAVFEVTGVNEQTSRKNKRKYEAKDEASALALAADDGLTGPYAVIPLPIDAPTESQVKYLQSWGMTVPEGASKYDVSAILSRLEDAHDIASEKDIAPNMKVERVYPLPSPSKEFAQYADAMGVQFSRYIGKEVLFNSTVYNLTGWEKAAFYAYCVLCHAKGTEPGDLRKSAAVNELYAFADIAANDATVMRSIVGREADDYLHPHKGSAAYKAVANHFGL